MKRALYIGTLVVLLVLCTIGLVREINRIGSAPPAPSCVMLGLEGVPASIMVHDVESFDVNGGCIDIERRDGVRLGFCKVLAFRAPSCETPE